MIQVEILPYHITSHGLGGVCVHVLYMHDQDRVAEAEVSKQLQTKQNR